jgi:hypothetical protein
MSKFRARRDINVSGDVVGGNKTTTVFPSSDYREEHYRIALNWKKGGPRMRAFNLSKRNLSKLKFTGADLIETNFEGAKLQCADLRDADLQGSNLREADLQGADLQRANLTHAQVKWEQLAKAKRLRRAIMPDGRLYDGRFNLKQDVYDSINSTNWTPGDGDQSNISDVSSPLASMIITLLVELSVLYQLYRFYINGEMLGDFREYISEFSKFYGVTEMEFRHGQVWASENGIPSFISVAQARPAVRKFLISAFTIILLIVLIVIPLFCSKEKEICQPLGSLFYWF